MAGLRPWAGASAAGHPAPARAEGGAAASGGAGSVVRPRLGRADQADQFREGISGAKDIGHRQKAICQRSSTISSPGLRSSIWALDLWLRTNEMAEVSVRR